MGNFTVLQIYATQHGLTCRFKTRRWGSEWEAWAALGWDGPKPIMRDVDEQCALDRAIAFQIRQHSYQARYLSHPVCFEGDLAMLLTGDDRHKPKRFSTL